jgi:glucose/arabinose dehydrogenase
MAQTTDFITGLTSPQGMAFNGNYLYVTLPNANKIIKIDVTADTPKATDVVTSLTTPRRLFFNGNDLYISEHGAK